MDLGTIFGIVLKNYRKKLGISQEDLAERCKLDRTFISLLERGKRRPTLNTVFTLAKKLDIKPYELIQEVEKLYEDYTSNKSS